jgi:hypothetical protein
MRVVGGIAVAALSYFVFNWFSFTELSNEIVLGISAALGVVAALFGWKAVKWIFELCDAFI